MRLELPDDTPDIYALADWMELNALAADDGNFSAGDVENALEIPFGNVEAARLAEEVLNEVERRRLAAGPGYPFGVSGHGLVQTRDDLEEYTIYVFCLCLSYFGWHVLKAAPANPWILFEEVGCTAAAGYTDGTVLRFGSPLVRGGPHFSNAIDELCKRLGEGKAFRIGSMQGLQPYDDKVDLVAWKNFPDSEASKLVLFGQCAGGHNWEGKVSELQPQPFWDQWMVDGKVSPLLRAFFMPHIVSRDRFLFNARKAGILFDRCRIAACSWTKRASVVNDRRYLNWCRTVFPELPNV